MKVFVRIKSENPWKEILPMFETETVGPCFIPKLKWGEKEAGEGKGGFHAHTGPPSGYTSSGEIAIKCFIFFVFSQAQETTNLVYSNY